MLPGRLASAMVTWNRVVICNAAALECASHTASSPRWVYTWPDANKYSLIESTHVTLGVH